MLNHPVHIPRMDQDIFPSALIPFCEFGGSMSAMGVKIDQFTVPVCNSFQAKILNGQLCYEVDLNQYSNKETVLKEVNAGLAFIMDYNEDRQITHNQNHDITEAESLVKWISEPEEDSDAHIYLNTIGKQICTITITIIFLAPVTLIGEGEYNLNILKEIKVTESFLGLDKDTRKCQNEEPILNCTSRHYTESILKKCGCIPANMRLSNKVKFAHLHLHLHSTSLNI